MVVYLAHKLMSFALSCHYLTETSYRVTNRRLANLHAGYAMDSIRRKGFAFAMDEPSEAALRQMYVLE